MATEHHNPRASTRQKDRADLLRLLHGELSAAAEARLRDRLAREPELAAALRRMEVTWDLLELPPAAPAPSGFAARVAARAAEQGRSRTGEAESAPFRPAWARAMAAAALTAGIVAGAAVGWLVIPEQSLSLQVAPAVSSTGAAGTPGPAEPAGSAATGAEPAAGSEIGTGTGSETGTGSTTAGQSGSGGLDSLAAGSVESLAESYWSAFAPEDDGGTTGGETLR
jgi:anti-sigma factor RsiW